jgi:predicted transcriptional regulator
MVKKAIREQARLLRQQGRSVREITRLLGVSKSSVSNWVRDIELTPVQIETLRANQRKYSGQNAGAKMNQKRAKEQRLQYQEAGRKKARQNSKLHLIGCMLYWAEGAKARNGIYFANSDPDMMRLFIRFLREELGVADYRISLLIHCHTDAPDEVRRIEQYWLETLNLPASALNKTQVKTGSLTRKNILEYGVCSIRVYCTELTHHIYGAIQEYGGFENPDWLF